MSFYTLSDKGKVRPNNEDYAESLALSWCGPLGNQIELTALILADGMGGAAAGEFASMLAVKTVKENIVKNLFEKQPEDLLNADKTLLLESWFQAANTAIFKEASQNPEMEGMGTTIVSGIIYRNGLALAHVGDSRAYRFHQNILHPITKDHSLVQELVDQGRITPDEAFIHPQRNVITRALGIGDAVKVDRKNIPLEYGDLVLFCSDGLCGFVEPVDLEEIVRSEYNPEGTDLKKLADLLIRGACLNGGGDNISVCLYQHLQKF
ncbi:MAG TPA: Stp1/IreP family PP2C-type Ser/Thr phosphatase [Candidatus Rifleibacterium sp.]|jgi:protein phosphatase|nr:Stp1/IreP family PP2C-type Ser/Thr phosphatase [Candidatus Rifleibacterium sp.]HQB82113.1 Stp1/IreP family PP2C-type Ser/Thr phosphatase [Candidatus Rifleibacterium sp.]